MGSAGHRHGLLLILRFVFERLCLFVFVKVGIALHAIVSTRKDDQVTPAPAFH